MRKIIEKYIYRIKSIKVYIEIDDKYENNLFLFIEPYTKLPYVYIGETNREYKLLPEKLNKIYVKLNKVEYEKLNDRF
jgi:hypothetical protein